jgi:hypothetical protein
MWNIMLRWNRGLTSSIWIFQTSSEHVLVALSVITWRAFSRRTGLIRLVLSSDRS